MTNEIRKETVTLHVDAGAYMPIVTALAKSIVEATGVTVLFEFNDKKYKVGLVRMGLSENLQIALEEDGVELIYLNR